MNLDLPALLADLGKTPPRAKLAALLALVALVAVISIAGTMSARPHFVTLYGSLDDAERVAVEKALAEGSVRYRVSSFPGPYAVYVDEDQYDRAQIVVALAEALKRAPTGINVSGEGASTLFLSAGERAQGMLKREWQETERLLEQLEFVAGATVTTSAPDTSPLRRKAPITVSVALKLRGAAELSSEQARTVGKMVRFRFGVPAENVVITDQSGRILFDESERDPSALAGAQPHEHAARYDRELAARTNEYLARTYGPGKALVTVASEWDFDHQTVVSESFDGDPREVSVLRHETRTPQGGEGAGGLAGTSSNLATEGFGVDNAAVPDLSASAPRPAEAATTSEEKTTYDIPRQRTQTVRVAPQLKRLSVSLAIDESLAAKKDEVRALVQAAVGFDAQRKDVIGVTATTLAVESVVDEGPSAEPGVEDAGGMSPTLQTLLERGVEILSALAFVALLAMTLKRGPAARTAAAHATGGAARGPAAAEPAPDPETLARAQIEELVRTDPRRVGEILSRWAAEEGAARKK